MERASDFAEAGRGEAHRARVASPSPLLSARSLAVRRGGRELFGGLDLELRAGELVALVGPNGVGKSTLLGLLAGLEAPQRGTLSFDGCALDAWSPDRLARRRALVLQSGGASLGLTALETVLLGRQPHFARRPGPRDLALARRALARFDARHLAQRAVDTLSGGEAQRVELARALVQIAGVTGRRGEPPAPALFLADEPTANLDPAHAHGALRVLADLARRGAAVLVALHDLHLAALHGDRVALLGPDGELCIGPPAEILREDRLSAAYGTPLRTLRDPLSGAPLVLPATRP